MNLLMWAVLLLLLSNHYSSGHKYHIVLDNEDVYSDCPNQPSNVLNVHGLFDFSEMKFETEGDLVKMSGNITSKWNIQPKDRIQARLDSFKMERSVWVKTIYSLAVPDLCKVLYDETQLWFPFWIKHITNRKEVKSKCFNVPGTKLVHEPFYLDIYFHMDGFSLSGRYKIVITLQAFDQWNTPRETSICYEIIREILRVT